MQASEVKESLERGVREGASEDPALWIDEVGVIQEEDRGGVVDLDRESEAIRPLAADLEGADLRLVFEAESGVLEIQGKQGITGFDGEKREDEGTRQGGVIRALDGADAEERGALEGEREGVETEKGEGEEAERPEEAEEAGGMAEGDPEPDRGRDMAAIAGGAEEEGTARTADALGKRRRRGGRRFGRGLRRRRGRKKGRASGRRRRVHPGSPVFGKR